MSSKKYGVDIERALTALRNVNAKLSAHGKCCPETVIERALIYVQLGYDDLAAFDAFVVYTLCQKQLSDEFVTDLEAHDLRGNPWHPSQDEAAALKLRALRLLFGCLSRLGATKDAAKFKAEHDAILTDGDDSLVASIDQSTLSHFGFSRREIYPWSDYEPSRNSPESVTEINGYLSTISNDVEAKVTALPAFDHNGAATGDESLQLGLFAKQDLPAGREILSEKSILTAIRPLDDAICDACGQELDGIPFEEIRQCDGDDCDITFCSEDCKTRAIAEYHQPLVEADEEEDEYDDALSDSGETEATSNQDDKESTPSTSSTHRAYFCSNPDLQTIGRPTNTETPEWDLYFLLLTRTIAMSLTQDQHPLSLIETKYLWGDFLPYSPSPTDSQPRTLPFSVTHNLQYTLDFFSTLSLTCPNATPYSAHWLQNYDFWILQTLFAKFRGVANASQSTFDGKPEIASVHPGWCLANHSCAPNVRWTPKGTRKFFVRNQGERVWETDGKDGVKEWEGVKAGEEIFSHYTDVRLSVGERRERLRQVLGGECRCERCIEEANDA